MKKIISLLIMCAMLASLCVVNVSAQVQETSNLVANGDFSNGATSWVLRAPTEGAEFSISTTGGPDGSACAYVTKSQGAGDLRLPISLGGLQSGDELVFSATVKLAGNCSSGATTSTAKWIGNNALLDTTGVSVPANTWTRVTYKVTLTETLLISGSFALRVSHGGDYNGGYYMDDVLVEKVGDGGLTNASFEHGLTGWTQKAGTGNTADVIYDASAPDGNYYAHVTAGTDAGSQPELNNENYYFTSGKYYEVSAKFKRGTNCTGVLYPEFHVTGSWIGGTIVAENNNDWVEVKASFKSAKTGALNTMLRLRNAENSGNKAMSYDYYIDDFRITEYDSMLLDASFELKNRNSNWTQSGTGNSVEYINDGTAHDGVYYAKITAATATPELNQTFDFVAGRMYEVKAYFKRDAGTTDMLYPELHAGGSWRGGAVVGAADTGWVEVKGAFIAATTANANVMLRLRSSEGSGNKTANYTYYLDDFSITECENTFAANAGFESGSEGWGYHSINHTVSVVETGAAEGSKCLQVYAKTATPEIYGVYPFVEGKTYVVSAKFKNDAASAENVVYPQLYANGAFKSTSATVTTGDWVDVKAVFVASDPTVTNGTAVMLRQRSAANSGNADAGYTYYLDDFEISEVSAITSGIWHEAAVTGSAKVAGSLVADVELFNSTTTGSKDNYAFLALYDGDGRLVDCDFIGNLYAAGNSVGKTQLTVDVQTADADAYAKIFVWSNGWVPYSDGLNVN